MEITLLFIFGLVIGSFLNVLICRYDENKFILNPKVIGGRSKCPECGKTLKWFELFPILSFLFLRGKCSGCKKPISLQYPIIEILSGLIFILVPLFIKKNAIIFFSNPAMVLDSLFFANIWQNIFIFAWILVFIQLVILFMIDKRKMIIPDETNLIIALLGILVSMAFIHVGQFNDFGGSFIGGYASLFGFRDNIIINRLIAIAFSTLFLGGIILFSRGRGMGMGDLKLAIALSFCFGWPDIVLILMLSFIIGAIATVPLIFKKQKGMKSKVPFGPFIAISAIIVFFFGTPILNIYFNLFAI